MTTRTTGMPTQYFTEKSIKFAAQGKVMTMGAVGAKRPRLRPYEAIRYTHRCCLLADGEMAGASNLSRGHEVPDFLLGPANELHRAKHALELIGRSVV